MDLANILADLKAAQDDFRQSDKAFATATFCQRTCKVLDEVVKGTENEEFENLVIGIWIVISSVNDLLPQLIEGPLLTELAEKLFRQCARVVLDIKWQQLDPSESSRENLENALSLCHQYMAPRGFTRFGVVNGLMAEPWTDPTLTMVMGSEEDNEEGEGLAYIRAQDPEILKLRVDLMYQENCDEFALNLCFWCLKHPVLAGDFTLHKIQFVLLHRLGLIDRLQEECQSMGVVDSIRLINSLHGKEEHKELCTMLAQTFLVQNWIKPSEDNSKVELLRLWIRLQYQADEDQDNFVSNLWAVAKVSRSTEQLLLIIDAVREKCGDTLLQFYLDLCIFAINVDKGCWEKLKESAKTGPNEELMARKRDMAQVCNKLAHIVSHVSAKVAFCCALTSFAMVPSEQSLQAVRDAYQRKCHAETSSKAQCCSNCASEAGGCLKNEDRDKKNRDVNVATLYEVERLCSMLRPSYLSCDSDLPSLLSLCKQYLRKEKGEPVRSALLQQKSLPSVQGTSFAMSAAGTSQDVSSVPVQQRAAPVRRTVDASASVSNVDIPSATASVYSSGRSPRGRVTPVIQSDAASTHFIQRLVLNQLPSDTVQTLLNLIQTKQVSPVHLNHIMTQNPDRCVQILERFVSQFRQGGGVNPDTNEQRQQQDIQQQPQTPPEQLSQIRLQSVQQQVGISTVPQSDGMVAGGLQKKDRLTSTIHALQQTLTHRPLMGQTRMTGSIVRNQESIAQQLQVKPYPQQQARVSAQVQYSHIPKRGQHVRPIVPSISALHLSDSSEVKGTSVQVMSVKQPSPMQTSSSGAQILSTSKTSVHVSGSSVLSVQKAPQIVRLPSASGSISGLRPNSKPKILPKILHRTTEQTVGSEGTAAACCQPSSASSENAGNRRYSINNLLFTGEQQNNTLSIALPDTLPEISVDSISDTLQALSGPPSGGSQVMLTGPVSHLDMSASFSSNTRVIGNMPSTVSMSSVPAQISMGATQIQTSVPPEIASFQHDSGNFTHVPFSTPTTRASTPCTHPLPSFSSLFVPNPSAVRVSVPVSSALVSTTAFVSQSSDQKTSPGIACAQQLFSEEKAEDMGVKKSKEWHVTDKEKMMQLLKQAMTIKVEKKENHSVMSATNTQTPHQLSVLSGSVPLGGCKYTHGPAPNLSSLTRPLLRQSPQLVQTAVCRPKSQQPAPPVLQTPATSAPSVLGSSSVPTAQYLVTCMSSGTLLSTSSFVSSHHTSVAVQASSYIPPSLSSANQNTVISSKPANVISSKSPNVISSKPANRNTQIPAVQNYPMTSVPKTSFPKTSSYVAFPTHLSGCNTVDYTAEMFMPVQTSSVTSVKPMSSSSSTPQSVGSVKTYPKTESGGAHWAGETQMRPVTSETILTSILPEGGGVIERATSGNQSVATYRCIICATAFMTLNALRYHVKQICKPGLTVGNSVAVSKAKANEAGVETSTVFQCMRCFELCISEAGIREHKQVCVKGAKQKAKPKSKAKPRVVSPETEEATEAKVQELLNKCLGENRERLLQEAEAQAAKLANAKKKSSRKRPSVDEELTLVDQTVAADGGYLAKKPRQEETTTLTNLTRVTVHEHPGVRTACLNVQASVGNFRNVVESTTNTSFIETVTVPTSSLCTTTACSSLPITTVSTAAGASLETTSTSVAQAAAVIPSTPETEVMPATTTDTTAVCKEAQLADSKPQSEITSEAEQFSADASLQTINDMETDEAAEQHSSPADPLKNETAENAGSSPVQQDMKEAFPPPRYKELKGSCGRPFFKCLNCGQTLCSMQSLNEHWQECIIKNPLSEREDHVPKENKTTVDGDNSGTMDDDVKTGFNDARLCQCSKQSVNVKAVVAEGSVRVSSVPSVMRCADCNKDRVPSKLDGKNGSSAPLVKQSVVVLEKISLPEKSTAEVFRIVENVDNETKNVETDQQSAEGNGSESLSDSSSTASLKRSTSKDIGLLGKTCKIHFSSPTKKDVTVEVISKDSSQGFGPDMENKPLKGDNRYCSVCKHSFSQPTDFVQHLAGVHLKLYSQRSVGKNIVYICHLCQQKFAGYNRYISHVVIHSQAIIQKFDEKNCGKVKPSEHRSVTDDTEECAGHQKKSQASQGDGPEEWNRNELDQRKCPTTLSSTTPSSANDRRSSGRAAQKQALNKIFISSLGINSFVEPLKESNKRKTSCEESSIAVNRPKRNRLSESMVEVIDSEDEENSEESSGETDEDDAFSKKSGDTRGPSTATFRSKAGEKASMSNNKVQTAKHGVEQSSACAHSPQGGALPLSTPKTQSHFPMAPQKPSFMDSFLHFVNTRSPDAPLPLYKSKRRYSYLHDNVESSTPTRPQWRRNSCEERMIHGTSSHQTAVLKLSPVMKSAHKSDSVSDTTLLPKCKSSEACVSKQSSSDFENVYFYGEFEKQLTQQVKVNLGCRVNPEEVQLKQTVKRQNSSEMPAINVKECSVNLGRKVNAEDLMNSVICLENVMLQEPILFEMSCNEEDSDSDTESDSDTVVASCSALSPVRDTEDTISLDGIPLVTNPGPPCSGLLPAADKTCVEATQPVFPPPKVVSLEKDSAATISSVLLPVSKETCISPVQTDVCENPLEETVRVTVSSVAFGSREIKPVSVTASSDETVDNAERTADSVGVKMDNVMVYSATVGDITTQHAAGDDVTTHHTTVGDFIPDSAAVDVNTTDSATIDDLTDSATVDDITVDCITVDDITVHCITMDDISTDSETVDDIIGSATVDDITADCTTVSDVTTDIATVDGILANSTAVDDITPDRATPGDITPPDKVTVDDVTADNAAIDDITADKATVDDITTNTALVDDITQVSATVDDIRADSVTVDDIVDNATVNDIIADTAPVDDITANTAPVDDITQVSASVGDNTLDSAAIRAITGSATVVNFIASSTTEDDFTVDSASVHDITPNNTTVDDIITENASVDDITTDNATVDDITTANATVDDTATDNATVDGSSRDATIADDITTGSAVVDDVTPDNMMAGDTTTENTGADDITGDSPVADDITRDCTVADDITIDNTEADDITAESIAADDIAMDKTVDDTETDKTVADDTVADEITRGNARAGDITTDRTVADDITTEKIVADDITTDTTVADDITTDTTVADDITTDTTVADDITTDTTVADDITTDTTVADDITTDNTVTDDTTTDRTVADDITTEKIVAGDITTDTTVADDITTDTTVADGITTDTTVTDDITTDTTVADDITTDTTVADDITTGTTVADDIMTGTTVADDIMTGTTVADDITTGTTVAHDITTGTTVADDMTSTTVADDITTGTTVADDITTGTTVADDITTGTTVADDIMTGTTVTVADDIMTGTTVADGITADNAVEDDITTDSVEADDITLESVVANDVSTTKTMAGDITTDSAGVDDITTYNGVAGDVTADRTETDDITTDQTMANSMIADNMTEEDVTTGKLSIAANGTAEDGNTGGRIAVDDITADSTAAVRMTTDNLTLDDRETDSATKDESTVDKCTLDGITTENTVIDDITTGSATADDVITENPTDDDLSVTVDDITQDNLVTGDITICDAVTNDITTDKSSVDDFSADSSADNFTTDSGTVDDLTTDNVTAINSTTEEGACESAADRVTFDISAETVAVNHISVESVTACDIDTGQERDCEQLLENGVVMVKHQVDTNTETVTHQDLHMEKSPSSSKFQDSRWTVLDEEESCNRSSLLVTKEFGFDQSVKEEGRKELSVDSELMAASENVSGISQDDEKEKSSEPGIPEMSDSEIHDKHTQISAAEAKECNEKSESLLEVREALPSTDSEKRPAYIDTCLPEGLSDLDTDQSVQTAEITEKTVSSKKEVSEFESGDESQKLGNADKMECDKKPELDMAVFPKVNQKNISLEHDVETNASSQSTDNSLSVFPQAETVCNTTHQNEESQEWTEKYSIPDTETSKETEGFWADGVVTSVDKEDEQNQEQNDTVSELLTVEENTHRNIHVVQLSREEAASQHDLDQSSKSAIELQEKQVFSAVDTLQKQQTTSTKETSVTSVEDDNNADGDLEVDDDIDCDGWGTGEDKVNCIDLPDESQIEETSISSCREIQSACERETSLSSLIDKHRVCDALDPSSKGNKVTETKSHSCSLLPASATPTERPPVAESPLPLGTDSTRQGESESVEALEKGDDYSLDANLRCDLHSVSSMDIEGQWKTTGKSANNSCESVEMTSDTFPPGCLCSSSLESSVQAQSKTFGTVCLSTCQTPITAAEVTTLPSSTRHQSLCCQQQVETKRPANSATGVEGTSQEPLPDGPAISLLSQQSVCNSDDSVNCSTHQLKTNDSGCRALEPSDLSADGADQFDQSPTVQQDQEGAHGVEKWQKTQGDFPWFSDPHRLESNGSASLLMDDGDSAVDSATMEVPKSSLDSPLSVMPGPGCTLVSDEMTSGSSIMEVQDCISARTETTCEQSQDITASKSFDKLENEGVFEEKRTLGVESAKVEVKVVLSDSTQVEAKDNETSSAFSTNTPLSDDNTTSTFFTQSEDSTSAVEVSSCSSMKSVVPERVLDDVDSESDLPELCIVPDPHGTIIKPCTSERSVKKKADTCESGCIREQNESSALVNESHERQYKSQRVSQKKKSQTTYIEIKEKEVVAKEDSEAQLESPTSSRKPLLGVKSLRHMHNPQPFVWDVEGEEDCKKRQRNERSLKAFRSKIHVAPFSWDQECSDQHKKTSEQTPMAASWDCDVVDVKTSHMDPENRETDSQKTASGSFGTVATRDEKYSSLTSGEGLFGGRFGSSRVQNMIEGADTEKCIKVKTLTTSAQGRLLPRPKGTLRSGSCEKTIVTLSRPCSSGDRKSMLSVEERPLRKSRSCDLEYSCVQSEHPLEPESSRTEKQQTKVTPMKMNIKIEDRGESCITKGLKSSTKSYQHSERQASTPRKKSLRQHEPVSDYSKTERGEGCSSTDARVDKIGSKQSVERNVKEEKSEEQRNEISTNLKNEYEGHGQQSGNTVSNTKLVGSKDVGLNKVDSHLGSNTSSKLATVTRQGSPLSDCVGSSRSHSSPTRQCRNCDRTPIREKDAGDGMLPELAQPDLSDCVKYLRNRLSKKPKGTGVEDTSLPHEGNETAPKKSSASVARKPAQAFAESAVKTWSPSNESSHYQSHSNKLVTPKSCAMLSAKRNSETDVLYPDSSIQRSQKSISHTQSPPESSQQYLTAMVRRRHRPVNWQTVAHQSPKKSRIAPPETPQYEIIRVEPVTSETSSSQQRVQPSEVMRAPRTLHTRVDDFSPVQRPEAAKRWQINRHITPAEKRKKKIADPNFPFSFKRARGRTRTK